MGKQPQQNRSEQKQPNQKNQPPPGQERRQRDEAPTDDELEEDAE
jgi:hypothetical protein